MDRALVLDSRFGRSGNSRRRVGERSGIRVRRGRFVLHGVLVYSAGLHLTTVPLDSTTYVRLKPEERGRLQAAGTPLTRSLESLYRLWLNDETSRMTLHDQMATWGPVTDLSVSGFDAGITAAPDSRAAGAR